MAFLRRYWVAVLAVAAVVLPLLAASPTLLHLLILVCMYAMLGQAWNVLGGYAGQVSVGHAVFFAIGAYTSTILLTNYNVSPWLGMVAGGVIAVAVSFVIGWPCFKAKSYYFLMATVGVAEIVRTLFVNWEWIGGAQGLFVPFLPESFAMMEFHGSKLPYYYIILAGFAVTVYFTWRIERSRLGYYLRTIKENEDAAESIGIDVVRYKFAALAISAFFTSLAGTFYAQYVMFIDPYSMMSLMVSVQISLIGILGGVGTLWGPLLGAAVLIPVSEFIRILLGGSGKGIHLIAYGLAIMLISVYQPNGLMGLVEQIRVRAGRRTRERGMDDAAA